MKVLSILALAGMAVIATTASGLAQNPPATAQGKPGDVQANASASNPEAAPNQPWMATGEDLKGPPQRFPAGQTPE